MPLSLGERYRHNKFRKVVTTTNTITLPPFSTTVVKGHTKLKGHGMRLNLIAEPPENTP